MLATSIFDQWHHNTNSRTTRNVVVHVLLRSNYWNLMGTQLVFQHYTIDRCRFSSLCNYVTHLHQLFQTPKNNIHQYSQVFNVYHFINTRRHNQYSKTRDGAVQCVPSSKKCNFDKVVVVDSTTSGIGYYITGHWLSSLITLYFCGIYYQLILLKLWPNTAQGCNHQSTCMLHADGSLYVQLLWYQSQDGWRLG